MDQWDSPSLLEARGIMQVHPSSSMSVVDLGRAHDVSPGVSSWHEVKHFLCYTGLLQGYTLLPVVCDFHGQNCG